MKLVKSRPADPIHPSTACATTASTLASVRAAFEAAFTPAVRDEVTVYAQRQWARVSKTIAWLSAVDLVQDAIVKTLDGTLPWRPEVQALSHHLKRVIANRIRWERRHAAAFPTVFSDARGDGKRTAKELAAAYVCAFHNERAAADAWRAALAALRDAAHDDARVSALYDAYEAGARTRSEVLAITRMNKRDYAAAYARMLRRTRGSGR